MTDVIMSPLRHVTMMASLLSSRSPSSRITRRLFFTMRPQRRLFYLTAAAACGSSLSSLNSCLAFAPATPLQNHAFHSLSTFPPGASSLLPILQQRQLPTHLSFNSHQTRLYSFSNKNKNDEKDSNTAAGGLLGALKRGAKKVLPFLQSDEEKQAALERKQVKQEIKGGIQQVLKDAPLPIRIMGNMIAPLLGSAVSQLGEAMSSQQELMDTLLQEAQAKMVRDACHFTSIGRTNPCWSTLSTRIFH